MNAAGAESWFPPIALYILLSLAVAVLSLAASSYREEWEETQRMGWAYLFRSSIVWGVLLGFTC